ncbi:hypothetical protein QTP70_016422 [Hemibagrus guttatus]|uniref:Uncharacterized protein n=1 Tax=Hemibagrus guttatus TaxID=175788 RepID=A0AAE0VCU5_9TELE|nr:hypothetical protein QTP70_016422 [Hemibagrus guttatus]
MAVVVNPGLDRSVDVRTEGVEQSGKDCFLLLANSLLKELLCSSLSTLWTCEAGLDSKLIVYGSLRMNTMRFIHSLSTAYPIYSPVTGSLCLSQASLGIKAGYTLDGVPTHHRAHTHTITLYRQFRDANQPTMHVFGPGEETRAPGGNPRGTGRTCKLHTHMAEVGIEPPTLEV